MPLAMRKYNDNDNDDNNDLEMTPIMITPSEDNESHLYLDDSEIELQRIAKKYKQKHNDRHSKCIYNLAVVGTGVLLFSISIFSMIHVASKENGGFGWGKNSKGYESYANIKDKVPMHSAFQRTRSKYLPAYQATMHQYVHVQTQAEFIAYVPTKNDGNPDKVFGISFRTKPTSDNGVAHILEHSVLNGSTNYPSKDPFLQLLKGSLNTYLNAMTYNDRTVYPVASRNVKDFHNLSSVYLDAVFKPRCVTPEGDWVLQQEGWRYEIKPDTTTDADGTVTTNIEGEELIVQGVVYSEMKGVYSNPLSLLSRQTDRYLYPDNTYGFDSGGDPSNSNPNSGGITTLTQEQFVKFYKDHYHPTNSKIFVSGTVEDVKNTMDLVDGYLKEYDYDPVIREQSKIKYQSKKQAHHTYHSIPYAASSDEDGQHMLQVTWLLNDEKDIKKFTPMMDLALKTLDYLLIGTSSSPLYKRLIDSGMGSNIIGYGLSPGLLQQTFAVGMKNVKKMDIAVLENLIFQILRDVVADGFSSEEIEAALNSIEFQLREVQTGSDPAGISIFLKLLTKWNYDFDPEPAIDFEKPLKKLKSTIKSQGSKFFTSIIQTYLLDNNHRVHMELSPSSTLDTDTSSREKILLQRLKSSLRSDQIQDIKGRAHHLHSIQESDDTLEVQNMIPSLKMSDIDRKGVEYDLDVVTNAYGKPFATVTKTVASGSPGIVYIDFGIDISSVPWNNVSLLPFIVTMLTESDTKTRTRAELDRLEGLHTGGISISLELVPQNDNEETDYITKNNKHAWSVLFFRGKCTVDKSGEMLDLIKDMAENSLPVSQEKVMQIIQQKISSIESSIVSSGHAYAVKRMHARYDVQSFFNEKWYGIAQLQELKNFLIKSETNWPHFQSRIEKVITSFSDFKAAEVIINLTGDNAALAAVDTSVRRFVSSLRESSEQSNLPDFFLTDHPWIENATEEMAKIVPIKDEGILISSQVSYVGVGGIIFQPGEKIGGQICAPLQFLKKGYLWETVRAKNGAYGVMAGLDKTDGFFYMVSYRDPQVTATIEAYNNAGKYLSDEITNGKITKKSITTAIIGCIGALDGSALPPREVGWTSFYRWLSGSSAVKRQKWRDEVLGTKRSDFQVFAQKLHTLSKSAEASIAVISSDNQLLASNLRLSRIDVS
eukprot:CAMPEP_0194074582 /NCGR_PEP_ID=MMETSP0149-20130528/1668_1 /TAXON_ID=122233 /ORGANISM="Chaetoceros debilis, Strain MM31A-1" /LENGTH=1160 /DNA_ID=CAMNT_0038754799 /DNA_START=82 /DNA_END=3564 /DNA_ORIENTATION=-